MTDRYPMLSCRFGCEDLVGTKPFCGRPENRGLPAIAFRRVKCRAQGGEFPCRSAPDADIGRSGFPSIGRRDGWRISGTTDHNATWSPAGYMSAIRPIADSRKSPANGPSDYSTNSARGSWSMLLIGTISIPLGRLPPLARYPETMMRLNPSRAASLIR